MPTSTIPITDDQDVRRDATTWAGVPSATLERFTGSALGQVQKGRAGVDPNFTWRVVNALLAFDSTQASPALPAGLATSDINSVVLTIVLDTKSGDSTRNWAGEYYAWDGSSATDWTDQATIPSGFEAFNVAYFSQPGSGNAVQITLGNLDKVSLTGLTKLRLQIPGGDPGTVNFRQGVRFMEDASANAFLTIDYDTPAGNTETLRPDAILSGASNTARTLAELQTDVP